MAKTLAESYAEWEPMRPGELVFECRDLGYGVEKDIAFGWFTGEIDTWGKHTFQESTALGGGQVFYLFPDEVVSFDAR